MNQTRNPTSFMAVVFAGHCVAALQEADVVGSTLLDFITLPALGTGRPCKG